MRPRKFATFIACLFAAAQVARAEEPAFPRFEVKPLAIDANEGIALADFNNDGKLDVAAGRNWYAAPAFIGRPLREIDDWNGYVQSNGDFAYDVDGDGWIDVIAGGFTTREVYWYRNPGAAGLAAGLLWERRLLFDSECESNEGNLMTDLDGDGVPEWIGNSWITPSPLSVWRFTKSDDNPAPAMTRFIVSQQGNGHGMGVGDVNGDGLLDIVCSTGWYECPSAEERYTKEWTFHPDWPATDFSLPVLIYDVDSDGRADIVWGTGHGFGLQWWRQLSPTSDGKTQWEPRVIDETFSQAHALALADLDGDGKDELITGKRFRAHNDGDPGAEMPPCVHAYSWNPASQQFDKQVLQSGLVGIGLQIRTGDLDGDGRTDIAVAGKSGTFLLLNRE
jgi:hypothetical protein